MLIDDEAEVSCVPRIRKLPFGINFKLRRGSAGRRGVQHYIQKVADDIEDCSIQRN